MKIDLKAVAVNMDKKKGISRLISILQKEHDILPVFNFLRRSSAVTFVLLMTYMSLFASFFRVTGVMEAVFFCFFLALDINNYFYVRSLNKSYKQLQYIEELSGAIRKTAKLSDVLDLAVKNLVKEFKYGKVLLFTFEHLGYRKDFLIPSAGHNIDMEALKDFHFKLDKNEDIVPRAAVERNSFIIKDAKDDYRCSQAFVEKLKLTEYAVVPLTVKDALVGVLLAGDKPKHKHLDKMDLATLSAYSNQTAVAVENAKMYEKIEQLAITDDLTNTYNQRYFNEALEKELERLTRYYKDPAEKVSIIVIELDNLKAYKESFGHHLGDTVLIETGQILKNMTRKIDVVARYGSAEFALLLPSTPKEGAVVLAERVINAIQEYPFENIKQLASKKITVCSGIATYEDDGKTSKALLEVISKKIVENKAKDKRGISYL
jgi:diguanylate cyclase (GGDEF)-like protein